MQFGNCGLFHCPGSIAHGGRVAPTLFCTLAVLLALSGIEASAQTLRLRSRAVVSGENVSAASVLQLREEGPLTEATLNEMQLPIVLPPGKQATVSRRQLIETLTQHQVNMAAVILTGSTRCTVIREPGVPQAHLQPFDAIADSDSTAPKLPALSLRSYILAHVAQTLHVDQEQVEFEFQSHDMPVLGLGQDEYEFRILNNDRINLGRTVLNVGVRRHQGEWERYNFSFQIAATLPVVVSKRTLNRGHIISDEDIEVRPKQVTDWNDVSIQNLAAAVGQRTRAQIHPGAVVRAAMLEAVPLVVRGELATIWFRNDGLSIKTVARAMEDGCLGQHAQFRNENSKEIFTAVVTGEGIGLASGSVMQVQEL